MRPTPLCTVVGVALACATFPFFKTTSAALADPSAFLVESVRSPAGSESSEPQLTTSGDWTLLSWIEIADDRTTLKFVERTTTGWSAPQVVTSTTDFYVIPDISPRSARSPMAPCSRTGHNRTPTPKRRRTTSGYRGRRTAGAPGRSRATRTTMGPRRSMDSRRCFQRPRASAWSGWTGGPPILGRPQVTWPCGQL